jgi:hypothetical protein
VRFSVPQATKVGLTQLTRHFLPAGLLLAVVALLAEGLLFSALLARVSALTEFEWRVLFRPSARTLRVILDLGLWSLLGAQLSWAFTAAASCHIALSQVRRVPLGFRALWPRRFLTTWSTVVLSTVLVFVGTLLFVVPGVWLAMALSPVVYCVVDSKRSPTEAIFHSIRLTRGHRFRLFGLHLVLGLLLAASSLLFGIGYFVFGLPLYFLTMAWVYARLNGEPV